MNQIKDVNDAAMGYYEVDWEPFREVEDVFDVLEERTDLYDSHIGDSYDRAKLRRRFLESYGQVRDQWHHPSKTPFEAFFRTLFWSESFWSGKENLWKGTREKILEMPEVERMMVESAWKPETVHRVAKLWQEVDLESLREVFDRQDRSRWRFNDFDVFKDYAEKHGQAVVSAAEAGRGLVVYIHG
ncbi:MAG: hypothetical protein ACR2GR_06375 [Rhodothermales bacterium]